MEVGIQCSSGYYQQVSQNILLKFLHLNWSPFRKQTHWKQESLAVLAVLDEYGEEEQGQEG